MNSPNFSRILSESHEAWPFEFPDNRADPDIPAVMHVPKESGATQWEDWDSLIRMLSHPVNMEMMVISAAMLHNRPERDIASLIHQTHSDTRCREAIKALRETAREHNWDGEDAEPISDEALSVALKVAGKLPGHLPAPDIYPDPEGRIEFDWALENGASFTLTVGPKGDAAVSASRAKGGFLRGWSKNDDDDDSVPDFVAFSLSWLEKTAVK